jgi:hypothetical protein
VAHVQSWPLLEQLRSLRKPSKYDAELISLAVPALASMMVDPLLNVISAGVLLMCQGLTQPCYSGRKA